MPLRRARLPPHDAGAEAQMTDAVAQRWGAAALQHALSALRPGCCVEAVAEDASTNTTLLERARVTAAPWPVLRVAERQTAGRAACSASGTRSRATR